MLFFWLMLFGIQIWMAKWMWTASLLQVGAASQAPTLPLPLILIWAAITSQAAWGLSICGASLSTTRWWGPSRLTGCTRNRAPRVGYNHSSLSNTSRAMDRTKSTAVWDCPGNLRALGCSFGEGEILGSRRGYLRCPWDITPTACLGRIPTRGSQRPSITSSLRPCSTSLQQRIISNTIHTTTHLNTSSNNNSSSSIMVWCLMECRITSIHHTSPNRRPKLSLKRRLRWYHLLRRALRLHEEALRTITWPVEEAEAVPITFQSQWGPLLLCLIAVRLRAERYKVSYCHKQTSEL